MRPPAQEVHLLKSLFNALKKSLLLFKYKEIRHKYVAVAILLNTSYDLLIKSYYPDLLQEHCFQNSFTKKENIIL